MRVMARLLILLTALACLAASGCDDGRIGAEASDKAFLAEAWQAYKTTFITPEGYVWDRSRDGGEVTSEGQSYALLRAVWMRDQPTFERVLAWTEKTLRRPDGLYSWRWRPNDGGRILDANTATDADQDIAYALILAAEAFKRPQYRERARELVKAVRAHASIPLPPGWLPAAGNWAVRERIVNISYFAPYAYAAFAELDPEGDWPAAVKAGYDFLARLRAMSPSGLIPDFAAADPQGVPVPLSGAQGLSGDFSYDAVRAYWRVALDCLLREDPRACADPVGTGVMAELLARDGAIYARYGLSGEKRDDVESLSFYGCLLPAFRLFRPTLADSLLTRKLSPKALEPILSNPDRYYDLNWVWFGLAAESGLITDEALR